MLKENSNVTWYVCFAILTWSHCVTLLQVTWNCICPQQFHTIEVSRYFTQSNKVFVFVLTGSQQSWEESNRVQPRPRWCCWPRNRGARLARATPGGARWRSLLSPPGADDGWWCVRSYGTGARVPVEQWHEPLEGYARLRACHAPECRERFPPHRGLAIPTCITARAWRTCRDACRHH